MLDNVTEWEVEASFIKRISYTASEYIPLKGHMTVNFITGVGYSYYVPFECVTDLLSADDLSDYFERCIVREYWDCCYRTSSSPEPDPAYGTTGRFSKYRNSSAMRDAIENAKQASAPMGDNSSWVAGKVDRVSGWIEKLAHASPELAENEKVRLAEIAKKEIARKEFAEQERARIAKELAEMEQARITRELAARKSRMDLLLSEDQRRTEVMRKMNWSEARMVKYEERCKKISDPSDSIFWLSWVFSVVAMIIYWSYFATPLHKNLWGKVDDWRESLFYLFVYPPIGPLLITGLFILLDNLYYKRILKLPVFLPRSAENIKAIERIKWEAAAGWTELQSLEWEKSEKERAAKAQIEERLAILESLRRADPIAKSDAQIAPIAAARPTPTPTPAVTPAITRPATRQLPKWLQWLAKIWAMLTAVPAPKKTRENLITSAPVTPSKKPVHVPLSPPRIVPSLADDSTSNREEQTPAPVTSPDFAAPTVTPPESLHQETQTSAEASRQENEESRPNWQNINSEQEPPAPLPPSVAIAPREEPEVAPAAKTLPDESNAASENSTRKPHIPKVSGVEPTPIEQPIQLDSQVPSVPEMANPAPAATKNPDTAQRPADTSLDEQRPVVQGLLEFKADTSDQTPPRTRTPRTPLIGTIPKPLILAPGVEGQRKVRTNYETVRNPKLREMAIQIHGRSCCVCGFNFDQFFGRELARGYIEVHHMKNIAAGERETNPLTDLAPLCANCHAMADRLTLDSESPPRTIDDLKGSSGILVG